MFPYAVEDHQSVFPQRCAVDIHFQDLSYTTQVWNLQKPFLTKKKILNGLCGSFRSGELTAIVGPSGAGKSTLLNVLAGFRIRGSSGEVVFNGKQRTVSNKDQLAPLLCYIQQEDYLRPFLTAYESMLLVAHLKLQNTTREEREKLVERLLSTLGLSVCQHVCTWKLSGGQKKRLSVSLELICNPPVIFLDEPTTGLDSSSATQCLSLLKLLAQEGRTIVCTVHQPSALQIEMFDHLYALADSSCVYQGSPKALLPFLAGLGLHCPLYHNVVDFLLDVSMGDCGCNVEALKEAASHLIPAIRATPEKCDDLELQPVITNGTVPGMKKKTEFSVKPVPKANVSLFLQFFLLYKRNLITIRRHYTNVLIRFLASITIGSLFGYLYKDVGYGADTIFANYVFIYGSILFLHYIGKMSIILAFPLEMNLLQWEHFNRWFTLGPYYLSHILLEIPLQILFSCVYLSIVYFLTSQPLDLHTAVMFFVIAIISSITAMGLGYFIGSTMPTKIAVFVGPLITVLLSALGFACFKRDSPKWLTYAFDISYFRATLHSVMTLIYSIQKELPCPTTEYYCHYRYPSTFMKEVDMEIVDIPRNIAMICGLGLLAFSSAFLAIWIRLNHR